MLVINGAYRDNVINVLYVGYLKRKGNSTLSYVYNTVTDSIRRIQ
jgi:hypothetical protein